MMHDSSHTVLVAAERAAAWRAHLRLRCASASTSATAGRRVLIADIMEAVQQHFGVTRMELVGECRARSYARPRQIAMYLASKLSGQSLPQIGRRFGDRDHTTVIHAIRSIERLRAIDAELGGDVAFLFDQLVVPVELGTGQVQAA